VAKLNIRNRNVGKHDKDGRPKPPNWEYRFEAAKVDGKRQSKSKSGFRTKKEAEAAGAKAMAEYNAAGLTFEPSEMSFADYLDYWFDNYVKMSCRYRTQQAYRTIIDKHLKPALGSYRLRSLTPVMLQDYVNKKYTAGMKKTTLDNILGVLTGSLKYAVVPAQLLQSSPAEYVKKPKVGAERTEVNRTIISVDDFGRMMERFPAGNPFRYALLLGFYTGLRIGEVYGLTWDDLDLKAGTLSVKRLAYKRSPGNKEDRAAWYFGDTKTPASVRTIKIGATLAGELRAYRTLQLQQRLEYGEYYTRIYRKAEKDEKGNTIHRLVEVESSVPVSLPEADLVMRKENGQYSSTDSFKYAARVIHYDLGVQFNFHSLRHTHATKLIEAGVSPKAVQARLGHENIETTLQTYAHNTEAMEQGAVDVFEAAVTTN
jgi:integrase